MYRRSDLRRDERVTVRALRWQRETTRYSSSRWKPSTKHKTQETNEAACNVKPSLFYKSLCYPLDALRQKLSTRVPHPDGLPFQMDQLWQFARTRKPHTVQCCVRTLLNGWPCVVLPHCTWQTILAASFGGGGDSDCGVHCWTHCTRLRGALELALSAHLAERMLFE